MNLTDQYRDAQRAYLATVEPWREALQYRDFYQKKLASYPSVEHMSTAEQNRTLLERRVTAINLKEAVIEWKRAKKARYEALCVLKTAEWHLKDSRKAWEILSRLSHETGAYADVREWDGEFRATLYSGRIPLFVQNPSREAAAKDLVKMVKEKSQSRA